MTKPHNKPWLKGSPLYIHNQKAIFVFCLMISLLFLSITTKSSPLYPFNDWVDPNASFTMGKGMLHGAVPYRDLFDHRGPLLFVIFGAGYLVSQTTFLGVFLIEVLFFSVFLFYCFRIAALFLSRSYALLMIPLLAFSVVNLRSFEHGGSPEEFCLPLIAISLFSLVDYFQNRSPDPPGARTMLLNGLIAGCILWVKFSLLGFWAGWVGVILLNLLIEKQAVQALKTAGSFLLGMLLATLPWLVYFGLHQAIGEWLNAYIVLNIVGYAGEFSLSSIFSSSLHGFLVSLAINPPAIIIHFLTGLIFFFVSNNFIQQARFKWFLLLCILLLAISVYGGGIIQIYYFLIFSVFFVFSFIAVFDLVQKNINTEKARQYLLIALLCLYPVSFGYTVVFHHNTDLLDTPQSDLAQNIFAERIGATKNATLLNYGMLDHGFFTTTGIVPNIKYFYRPNFFHARYPRIMNEQNRYIHDRIVDFVVTRGDFLMQGAASDRSTLEENYRLIDSVEQLFEGEPVEFLLYQKK